MRYASNYVFAITVVALLASCAATGPRVPTVKQMLLEATGQDGRACIRNSEIRGYGILDHDVVSIDAGRRYFLATVLPVCNDLEMSMQVLFRGDSYQICGGRMDDIVTREENCTIHQIFEFANRETAFDVFDSVVEKRNKLKEELAE